MRPKANIGRKTTRATYISSRRASEAQERRQERREANRDVPNVFYRIAFNYDPSEDYCSYPMLSIGKMDKVCTHCNALKYKAEPPGMCCSNGKVRLAPLAELVEPMKTLLQGDTPMSITFRKNIRKYNSAFQMTSFGANRVIESGYRTTFRIQGQVYHRIGSILPVNGEQSQFLQIYFVGDSEQEANRRMELFQGLNRNIVLELQNFLHQNNQYIRMFKTALDLMPGPEYGLVIRPDKVIRGDHKGRYNAPTAEDVAVVLVNSESPKREIILRKRNDQLQKICETHRSYDALQYPLMFWNGDDGYHFGMTQRDGKKISCMDYYAYKIMVRLYEDNYLLRCGYLFLQYLVDMLAKILSERLLYVKLNQTKLRVESYSNLKDSMLQDGDAQAVGKKVILPSTFIGSPRNMHEFGQDGMVYVRKYGCPDIFTTFTCNPGWSEIVENLLPGQTAVERPDIVARVFKQKLLLFMDFHTKQHVLGQVRCYLYTIEWQKRGLPHAHLLFWFKERIRADQIDSVICAEIPDPELDPVLYELVTKHMIHNPCGPNSGAPCMVDGKCSKNFPKNFCNETHTDGDSFPKYRRRSPEEGGFTTKVKIRYGRNRGQEIEVDNRWVVPYNPFLLKIFQAHINVEWCRSVKCIKYVCKYVCKGSDQAVYQVNNHLDEIESFINGRYISSSEAVWRILGFEIHEKHPMVMPLEVHLENGQRVYFNEDNLQAKLDNPASTHLTGFFELCREDTFARTLLYPDVPRYYRWDKSNKRFKRRERGELVEGYPGVHSSDALGRVYTVHPSNAECFYLRMLLHVVHGPQSFKCLKTVDGILCETFREACEMRGMLESDAQWVQAMEEASATSSAQSVRHLFAILLTTCAISTPQNLWNQFKDSMSEDIIYQLTRYQDQNYNVFENIDRIYNEALIRLEDICLRISSKGLKFWGLDTPQRDAQNSIFTELSKEMNYNIGEMQAYVTENVALLVEDQRIAYEEVLSSISRNRGELIFLDAPGGTGKTFLINLLLSKIRSEGKLALAVASSGIAATLLQGGRTAHSTFKLPLNLKQADCEIVCNISRNSPSAQVLKQCDLIIWDECTMAHKRGLEALNNTLKDIRGNELLFGGCVVVLAGDFRQILPVVVDGTPADQINACLKSSQLWRHVTTLTLTTNMRTRLSGDLEAERFSTKLLTVGNGTLDIDQSGKVDLSDSALCQLVESEDSLIEKVYPDFMENYTNIDWLSKRSILAPKVDIVKSLNLKIQSMIPGEARTYYSIDTVTDQDQVLNFPAEFLNSLNPAGLPVHQLELKVGSMIILMRNLDPPKLCNGTRLLITNLHNNLIEAVILSKTGKGEKVFIPRIPLIPNDCPVEFKRLQFPVQLAFAITINKSQGQTFEIVGVYLGEDCFTHGQLYVAFSRVGSAENLFVFSTDKKAKNIVFKGVL